MAAEPQQVAIHGLVNDKVFQQCSEAAQYLNKEYAAEYRVSITNELPFEFEKKRKELHDLCLITDDSTRVIVEFAGTTRKFMTGEAFIEKIVTSTGFRLFDLPDDDPQSYGQLARAAYAKMLKVRNNTYVWMLISIAGVPQSKVVFELFSNALPRTCQNFLHLCRGDLPDTVGTNGQQLKLSYKGTPFYRVVKGGWVQGGDITPPHTGNGGYSCYGRYLPDESFHVAHDAPGILGMANDGEHTNSSSFYVTVKKSSWMDKKYVAFGRVMEGLAVIQAIHDADLRHNQSPKVPIIITDCGQLTL
jgi:peptidylprolyl isomerase